LPEILIRIMTFLNILKKSKKKLDFLSNKFIFA